MEKNSKNNLEKNIKRLQALLITLVLILAAIGIFVLVFYLKDKNEIDKPLANEETPVAVEPVILDISQDELKKYNISYETNYARNSDYAGQIIFSSGIIDEPFVYSKDNADYLRRNFYTGEYHLLGTVFMDYEDTLSSKNIILYGHNVYATYDSGYDENGNKIDNDTLMFTPLKFLTDKNYYDDNHALRLVLKDEVREYEIVSVFYIDCVIDENEVVYPPIDMQYNLVSFDDDYFREYKKAIKEKEFYDTGIEFSNKDNLLTLQTCVEGNKLQREIVICKEVSSLKLN